MIECLMWIVTAASILGTWLNARQSIRCFPIWLATNACWIAYAIHKGAPAQAGLFLVYSFLAIYGWRSWRKPPVARQSL